MPKKKRNQKQLKISWIESMEDIDLIREKCVCNGEEDYSF
jgi:hypothetical protein